MTDREMLELAAKSAAISPEDGGPIVVYDGSGVWLSEDLYWNPLTDDGDALRLAVKLRMMLDDIRQGYMAGYVVAVCNESYYEPREPDPFAATRRAIVRAAAAIGKEMP